MDTLKPRIHPPAYKAKVAIEALKEQLTISQIASQYSVHPTQINHWKQIAKQGLTDLFSDKRKKPDKTEDELINQLYQQIGQLTVERDWLKKRWGCLSENLSVRQKVSHLENSNDQLSLSRQCELLGISRSNWYYQPEPVGTFNLDLMNRIDKLYTACPFYGSRKLTVELSNQLHQDINRKRVQRLMRLMGIEAICPKPDFSKSNSEHRRYPYILKGFTITRSNQVWGTDITYIKLSGGFLYVVAFIDWYSRFVLDWQLSNSLEADFCCESANRALQITYPEITNSDQGSQFTSEKYLNIWESRQIKISMDGRGRCMDNIFTERLWRSLKYEEVYPKSYASVAEARAGITSWFDFYNHKRVHQSLNYKTPAQVYFQTSFN